MGARDQAVDQQPFDDCAHCGASLERGVTYPVETRAGQDDELELYSFCDEACQRVWTGGS